MGKFNFRRKARELTEAEFEEFKEMMESFKGPMNEVYEVLCSNMTKEDFEYVESMKPLMNKTTEQAEKFGKIQGVKFERFVEEIKFYMGLEAMLYLGDKTAFNKLNMLSPIFLRYFESEKKGE